MSRLNTVVHLVTPNEWLHCLLAAGFPNDPGVLRVAGAVILAESAGDCLAIGRSDTGNYIGNWDLGGGQESNRWQHPILVRDANAGKNWRDPYVAAAQMFEVYSRNGNTFKPWTAFNNGSFEARLPDMDIALIGGPMPYLGGPEVAALARLMSR